MAIVICCPCGTPIDFEHLELVVSLTCPKCQRELDLEIEIGPVDRRRAVLTVMEGPHWVGERFLLPIGVDLKIGQAENNWISLDDDDVSNVHCRLHVKPNGALHVEDLKSQTGTWIGDQRIATGKLGPKQSLRVGAFRLRLDYLSAGGTAIVPAPKSAVSDASGLLPTMRTVSGKKTATNSLITNRFRLARWILVACSLAAAPYHILELHQRSNLAWRWPTSIFIGALIAAVMMVASRRVTLTHKQYRYAPMGLLLVLAIADLVWRLPMPACVWLGCAAAVSLLVIERNLRPSAAITGVIIGTASSIIMIVGSMISMMG